MDVYYEGEGEYQGGVIVLIRNKGVHGVVLEGFFVMFA